MVSVRPPGDPLKGLRFTQGGVGVYIRVQHAGGAVVDWPDAAAARAVQFEAGASLAERFPASRTVGERPAPADLTGTCLFFRIVHRFTPELF